jgi:hypothetical protein
VGTHRLLRIPPHPVALHQRVRERVACRLGLLQRSLYVVGKADARLLLLPRLVRRPIDECLRLLTVVTPCR